MIFDWIGEGFIFGQKVSFFQITTEGVPLVYSIYRTTTLSDNPFSIERIKKNINHINIKHEIEEEVKRSFIIETDDDFRKKFKRSYKIIKLETENSVITIGGYTDNEKRMSADNTYILCEKDFINILAKAEFIKDVNMLDNSPFEPIKPIFDKKELAIELLKD